MEFLLLNVRPRLNIRLRPNISN